MQSNIFWLHALCNVWFQPKSKLWFPEFFLLEGRSQITRHGVIISPSLPNMVGLVDSVRDTSADTETLKNSIKLTLYLRQYFTETTLGQGISFSNPAVCTSLPNSAQLTSDWTAGCLSCSTCLRFIVMCTVGFTVLHYRPVSATTMIKVWRSPTVPNQLLFQQLCWASQILFWHVCCWF